MTNQNLFEKLQKIFQCGATADVIDDVALSEVNQEAKPELSAIEESPSTSSSSIYIVPSREALEEMVRESKFTRRQGLFDMDRLFACGSQENVAFEDSELSVPTTQFVPRSTAETHDDATIASVFSRSAPGLAKDSLLQKRGMDGTRQPENNPEQVVRGRDRTSNRAYHYRIRMSVSPSDHIFRKTTTTKDLDSTMNIRRTRSESMSSCASTVTDTPSLDPSLISLSRGRSPPPPLSRCNSITSE